MKKHFVILFLAGVFCGCSAMNGEGLVSRLKGLYPVVADVNTDLVDLCEQSDLFKMSNVNKRVNQLIIKMTGIISGKDQQACDILDKLSKYELQCSGKQLNWFAVDVIEPFFAQMSKVQTQYSWHILFLLHFIFSAFVTMYNLYSYSSDFNLALKTLELRYIIDRMPHLS